MASLNKVMVIGNLGKDPETRDAGGNPVANFFIAASEKWKDKNGEMQEKTEWIRVAAFGKLAEICSKYLKKGSQVYVEGRLQTRKWQDKDGKDQYMTEVVANSMQMLGSRIGGGEDSKPAPAKPASKGGKFDDFEDDIPF